MREPRIAELTENVRVPLFWQQPLDSQPVLPKGTRCLVAAYDSKIRMAMAVFTPEATGAGMTAQGVRDTMAAKPDGVLIPEGYLKVLDPQPVLAKAA